MRETRRRGEAGEGEGRRGEGGGGQRREVRGVVKWYAHEAAVLSILTEFATQGNTCKCRLFNEHILLGSNRADSCRLL